MKPAPFTYVAPRSAEEAQALLAQYGDEARVLAGGQSLMPLIVMRMARPAFLIDLNRCGDLFYLRSDGDWIACGAMTRQADAEKSELVRSACPILADVLTYVGHPTNRNRGTVGGTLAHADPAAELPGLALALGAEFVVEGPAGRRVIRAEDFFIDSLTTSMNTGEMLREVRFPKTTSATRSAFVERGVRRADIAIAGVAAHLELANDGSCKTASVVAIGAGPTPTRLVSVERVLRGAPLTEESIRDAAESAGNDVDPPNDLQATSEYRRKLLPVLTARALRKAVGLEASA